MKRNYLCHWMNIPIIMGIITNDIKNEQQQQQNRQWKYFDISWPSFASIQTITVYNLSGQKGKSNALLNILSNQQIAKLLLVHRNEEIDIYSLKMYSESQLLLVYVYCSARLSFNGNHPNDQIEYSQCVSCYLVLLLQLLLSLLILSSLNSMWHNRFVIYKFYFYFLAMEPHFHITASILFDSFLLFQLTEFGTIAPHGWKYSREKKHIYICTYRCIQKKNTMRSMSIAEYSTPYSTNIDFKWQNEQHLHSK